MAQKRVKPEDCFESIAASNKFFNYQTVYGFDDNAAQHPHPNQLVEGSVVKIPDKVQKTVNLTLDATNVFVVVQRKTKMTQTMTQMLNLRALAPSKLWENWWTWSGSNRRPGQRVLRNRERTGLTHVPAVPTRT